MEVATFSLGVIDYLMNDPICPRSLPPLRFAFLLFGPEQHCKNMCSSQCYLNEGAMYYGSPLNHTQGHRIPLGVYFFSPLAAEHSQNCKNSLVYRGKKDLVGWLKLALFLPLPCS